MRSILRACTMAMTVTTLLLAGAVSTQASTIDPGDVDPEPPAPIVLPEDDAAAASVTLTATFSCMKSQGEAPAGSTAAQVLGRVTETGDILPPTGTPLTPSDGCVNGAVAVIMNNVNFETEARLALSLRTLERNISTGRTPVPPVTSAPPSDTMSVARVPEYNACPGRTSAALADRRYWTRQRGLINSVNGFMSARAGCSPRFMVWTTDECSIGNPLNNSGYNFRNACLRHDYNWRNLKDTGGFYKRNKAIADGQFAKDMGVRCRELPTSKHKGCYSLAATYASAVRIAQLNTTGYYPSGSYAW